MLILADLFNKSLFHRLFNLLASLFNCSADERMCRRPAGSKFDHCTVRRFVSIPTDVICALTSRKLFVFRKHLINRIAQRLTWFVRAIYRMRSIELVRRSRYRNNLPSAAVNDLCAGLCCPASLLDSTRLQWREAVPEFGDIDLNAHAH